MFIKICALLIVCAAVAVTAAPTELLRKARDTTAEVQADSTAIENVQVSDSEWQEYKEKFNKTYTDAADEAERRAIYLDTKKFVEAHNKEHAEGKSSFTVGINQFADRKPSEKHHGGLIRPSDRIVKE